MKKNKAGLNLFIFLLLLVVFVYLSLPVGEVPSLSDSLKSDEPGDTVEMAGVSAYYTDKKREEVVAFYKSYFEKSSFLGLPLPVIVLDHPPEYGRQAIRDTTETTFLYELVHPGRDSLFINGFDPLEKPGTKATSGLVKGVEKNGRFWERKITLRLVSSFFLVRWLIAFLGFFFLGRILKEIVGVFVSFRGSG